MRADRPRRRAAFGAMTFGADWGFGADEASAIRLGVPHDNWRRWFGTLHEDLDPRIRPVGRKLLGMPRHGWGKGRRCSPASPHPG